MRDRRWRHRIAVRAPAARARERSDRAHRGKRL